MRTPLERQRDLIAPLLVIAIGGGLNVVAVGHGISGVWGVGPGWAALGAIVALTMQILFHSQTKGNGAWLNSAFWGLFWILVAGNIVMSAAGITAGLAADNLGRNQFEDATREILEATDATADGFAKLSGAMNAAATRSSAMDQVERTGDGGTCGVAAGRGYGDFAKAREADAREFSVQTQSIAALAAKARSASRFVRKTIANYNAETHVTAARKIDEAVAEARNAANSSEMEAARGWLASRKEQFATGRPIEGGKLVRCPDGELERLVDQALEVPSPTPPPQLDAPPVPSDRSSVEGLVAELGRLMTGQDFDLGPWSMALRFAPLPDTIFLAGLSLLARRLRSRRTILGDVAEDLGIPVDDDVWDEIMTAMQATAHDPSLAALEEIHAFVPRILSRADWLLIPIDGRYDPLRHFAEELACAVATRAKFIGRGPMRVIVGRRAITDLNPDVICDCFRLEVGVWARLRRDARRAAPRGAADAEYAEAAE